MASTRPLKVCYGVWKTSAAVPPGIRRILQMHDRIEIWRTQNTSQHLELLISVPEPICYSGAGYVILLEDALRR